MPDILHLDQITDDSVGGKAHGLSRLVAMGLRVPEAFVIRGAQSADFPDDLDRHFDELGGGPVAVRSSAVGEDGAESSFAGQYETVLNVIGSEQLRAAIDLCVESTESQRAASYRSDRPGEARTTMNLVIQRMVDARSAGVAFTADPVSGRRDLAIIDAVGGLGESLVSGEATPDHFGVDRSGTIVRRQLVGEAPLLSDAEISTIAREARLAAEHEGHPLDLEWAINHDGVLFWLQARPITTLPSDLNEFDTTLPRPDDVLTISNVSEMMPGAVCPLTMSFTGWGIDYGVQHMQVEVGAREHIDADWQVTASAYGHLFLNLTGNLVMSAGVLGSNAERTAQTICGRIVPELKDLPPLALPRRVYNMTKLLRYCKDAPRVVDEFDRELGAFTIATPSDSRAAWTEIAGRLWFFDHAMAVHIQSSALSGMLSAIVENMVSSTSNESTIEEQAEAVRLLAGASDVESAVMLDQLDELIDRVAAHPDSATSFATVGTEDAVDWLRSTPETSSAFAEFLTNHGHRGYRELCVRDPSWGDDPTPLIQSMQAATRARSVAGGQRTKPPDEADTTGLSRGLRWMLPRAHAAIRRREHTKSLLVESAYRFKQAFRHLGQRMTAEGLIPDADLIYFFTTQELASCEAKPSAAAIHQALARRRALESQQRLEFAEISVGLPAPVEHQTVDVTDGVLLGRPASRGVVEGIVRVAHTLDEAALLESGEILVTPITDIGWTPYFSMIGGLVTDLGSSVSHGAVIAREYGLPCVVNARQATRLLRTGDRVRLDGSAGTVTRLDTNDGEQQ